MPSAAFGVQVSKMHRITPEELDKIQTLILSNRSNPDYEAIAEQTGRSVTTVKRIGRVIKQNAIEYRTKAALRVCRYKIQKRTDTQGREVGSVALEVVGRRS